MGSSSALLARTLRSHGLAPRSTAIRSGSDRDARRMCYDLELQRRWTEWTMALLDCIDGTARALYDSYEYLRATYGKKHESWERTATMMLAILPRLEELFAEREVWGLVSHYRLCLLSRRDFRARRHVTVGADARGYHVTYLLHREGTPWPGVEVWETLDGVEATLAGLPIFMERSEGWKPDGDFRWKHS